MSEGNAIFLVCLPCKEAEEKDFGVRLAERSRIGFYQPSVPQNQLAAWLRKHAKCGRPDTDHFKLGYLLEKNHDQPKRKSVKQAVEETLQ